MYLDTLYTKLYSERNWSGLSQLVNECRSFDYNFNGYALSDRNKAALNRKLQLAQQGKLKARPGLSRYDTNAGILNAMQYKDEYNLGFGKTLDNGYRLDGVADYYGGSMNANVFAPITRAFKITDADFDRRKLMKQKAQVEAGLAQGNQATQQSQYKPNLTAVQGGVNPNQHPAQPQSEPNVIKFPQGSKVQTRVASEKWNSLRTRFYSKK